MKIQRVAVRNYRVFRDLDVELRSGLNVIVGDNESGKSTLMEAMTLALTGRIHGRWARDQLTAAWFNLEAVSAFFEGSGRPAELPVIEIELYLDEVGDEVQVHRGVHNSRAEDAVGLRLTISPSDDFADELIAYLGDTDRPPVLPIEYYTVRWSDFADQDLPRRPRGLGHIFIDARTIRSTAGVDHHTRLLVNDYLEPHERAAISIAQRTSGQESTRLGLAAANERIAQRDDALLKNRALQLQVDEASGSRWATGVVPAVDGVPFALAGQGLQAVVKTSLAVSASTSSDAFVFVEEPENHLSHTTLTRLLAAVERLGEGRQTIVATHSSFVLNRLGLDRLVLLTEGRAAVFAHLPDDTVRFFQRLSGYDTLRLVLAERVVLVEGPSDDLVFSRFYHDATGRRPQDDGIDVISMHGVSLKRSFQLAAAMDRQLIALRDNDDQPPQHWAAPVADHLEAGSRELYIGDLDGGKTLEPQLAHVNTTATLREVLGLDNEVDSLAWMTSHKTEAALRIAESETTLMPPNYIADAIQALQ